MAWESRIHKKSSWNSAPVQKSMFTPRGWSKPDTSVQSEEQLPDLPTIGDNYVKRPSFIERLAIHPPQPTLAGDVDTGNIQHKEGEEKPEENLQTKPLADTVHSLPELQPRIWLTSRFSQYTHNSPSADLDRFFAPTIRSANVQRQQATEEEEKDENLQMKPEAQVQLQETEEEKSEEDLQTKPLAEIQRQETQEEEEIQTKLTVGAPGDKYEQEANQMAAKVMAMPETETPQLIQQQAEEEEEVQMKPLAESITPLIQRQTAEGEELEEVQMLQRKAGGSFSASSNVESSLNASKGSGSPLADNVREFMETRFGADFSSVRVHADSNAVQMNKELGAQAFTHGSHVYYGAGKSPDNNELTAHELTHVVQQTGANKLHKKVHRRLNNKEESNKLKHKQQGDRPHNSSLNKEISSFESKNNTKFPEKSSLEITKAAPEKTGELSTNFHPQPNKDAPKLKASETGGKEKASFEAATAQNQPQIDIGATPKNLSTAQVKPTNPATNGKLENSTPEMNAATGTFTSAPASQVDATPAMESMGNTADSAVDKEQGLAGDDKELETIATATEGVELEAGDRTNAIASLAEVSDSGGAAAEGAGGGGGGGAAITDKPAPPVPDVSQAEPNQALAAISQLPPAQLQAGLGSVTAAVANTVSKEQSELAANPPQMERPSGSPMTKEGVAGVAVPTGKAPKPVEKAPAGQAHPVPLPQPLPPLPPPPIQSVPQPSSDPQSIKASLEHLPTRDSNLNVTAGSPPPLELKGDADPKQTQEQKAKLEKSVADTHAQGQQALAQPMGEDEIYPHVPKETLKAEAIRAGGGGTIAIGGAAGAVKGTEGDEAVSIIAQQEHGQEIQSAVAQAQGQMVAQKQEHTAQVAQQKDKSNKEITKLQSESEAQQTQERAKAHTEVSQQRQAWNKEQTALVEKSRKDADSEVAKGMKNVQHEQAQAEVKATEHIEKGNQEAETARKQGEEQATLEKRKGEQDSGGIFGWLADKAKAFFDGIKQAIQKAFEIARAAVKVAIDTAKKLATAVIEAARKAIVTIIKAVGEALIAIGNVLLAAFPEMRDRFSNAIKSVVQKAEAAVNFLADKLKQGVQAALNLLGKGLDAALGLMEKGILAAVEIANKATQAAISAAKFAVEVLGAFAVLAKDIAANPGQWLSNLGAGVMDGIRNHLWTAFQAAVKDWFNQKLEEVLGLGMTIWKVLSQGGINLSEVGRMAWEGIKSAIPPALIQILIEKLVSMIVPAAGTVLLIIEGLQAAWGTVSRILQAMQQFMAFMKAVKSGQSGPQFGAMLAAAGVILIDFVANWLLKRVRGAASKVAGKIREIAKKIGDKLKGAFAKLKKGLGKLKDKFFAKKGNRDRNDARGTKNKKDDKDRKNQEKLDKAVAAIKPQASQMLRSGTSKLYLIAKLLFWKVRYQLTSLTLDGGGTIRAKVNPEADISKVKNADLGRLLMPIFAKAEQIYEEKLLNDPKTKQKIDSARQKWANREPQSLAGLSRYEQSMVIRDTHVPSLDLNNPKEAAKKGATEVEPDVTVWIHWRGGSRGMVQRVTKYDTLMKNIVKKADYYGISQREVASIIFGHPDAQQAKFNVLDMRMRQKVQSDSRDGGITKKAAKSMDKFVRQLRATTLLVQAYEPSRVPGIATATIVSSTMAKNGDANASLEEVLGSKGSMAPMTPKGAAPEKGQATTKKQLDAQEKRYERVGNIFQHLLTTAKSQKVLVTEGGYDLSHLVSAIDSWVSQKLSKDPQHLAASETVLHAELIKLISSSHREV